MNWMTFRSITWTLAALLYCSPTIAQDKAPVVTIKVQPDRENAIYKVGESAEFAIEVSSDGGPVPDSVTCIVTEDGIHPQAPQKLTLDGGKAKIRTSLDKPGFILLKTSTAKTTALAGAAFSPLEIKPSLPVPDDFDQFWAEQKKALTAVPLKARLDKVDLPKPEYEAFDVKIDCVGAPVSGYFGKPHSAKPKSLPAILLVHGAGVRSASLGSTGWALREGGMLAMDINAHGIENGKPEEFYKQLADNELKDYRYVGRDDRAKCYFTGMFLRLIRAIDFLTAQPEWDGKTLIVYGSSQGGFQALAAAGLDERVSFICAGVPAGCDHTGSEVGRINGWPKLVPLDAEGKADPKVLQAARYVDCVNFASRAKCRGAAVTVGYIDTVCPPTSVYAAYNALPISKSIHADILSGHTSTPAASKFMTDAALAHIRSQRQ